VPKVLQFVTVIAGACWYQLAIRDDTWGPCSSIVQAPDQFMDTLGAY
jgi:hypothetical protein